MSAAWPSLTANSAEVCKAEGVQTPGEAEVLAAPPAPARTRKRYVRLENGPQIRREMARVYRGLENDEIELDKAKGLIHALSLLGRAIEAEKVERLEQRLDEAGGN